MIRTKYHTFEEFRKFEHGMKEHGATQLMRMYRIARTLPKPKILELGTRRGASTTVFLQACEENDGKLVSVDIDRWDDLSNSSRWIFVQSDSTDIKSILSQAPLLNNGIDILYIDSLHEKEHVEQELLGWYPYMKAGSHIFLDDVDANPYREGNRKDNIKKEIQRDKIREFVEAFYYSNEDVLYLEIMLGTTGLAHITKLSPKGTMPLAPKPIVHRR